MAQKIATTLSHISMLTWGLRTSRPPDILVDLNLGFYTIALQLSHMEGKERFFVLPEISNKNKLKFCSNILLASISIYSNIQYFEKRLNIVYEVSFNLFYKFQSI